MMKFFLLLVILFQINAGISYAQIPVQLDKASNNTGVTSPLPDTVTSEQTQEGINYYPDTRLSEFITKIFLLSGILMLITGTALVTIHSWFGLFHFKGKDESLVLSKHFGHQI